MSGEVAGLSEFSRNEDRALLPCPDCGAECFHAEEVRAEMKRDFRFQGKQATTKVTGKKCPNCGREFPL